METPKQVVDEVLVMEEDRVLEEQPEWKDEEEVGP